MLSVGNIDMWMWTFVLLLRTYVTVGVSQDTAKSINCPTQCTCSPPDAATDLVVDCSGRAGVNLEQLSEELDSLLMYNLISLTITNTPLTHFPRSICRLTTLTRLFLDNNNLTQLPEKCLTSLSNLEVFTAVDNIIETLEGEMFEGLTKLRYLNLSSNRIESIGSSICQLTSLTTLDLDHNQITGVPVCLNNLTNLELLSAYNNVIETLQDGVFNGLTKLFYLDVRRNRISSIGSSVCQLTALTGLYISDNQITRLPDNCFSNLTNLQVLWANDNAIETLQIGVFDRLMKLLYLDLSFNRISSIDSSVCQLTALTDLYFYANRLTHLPVNCLGNLTSLKVFYAANNAIETLQHGIFDGLTKLEFLYLSTNRISSLDLSICKLTALTHLYLDHNGLTRLPDNCLSNLTNLELLSASENAIEILQDGVFDGLTKLKSLYIDSNKISSIGLSVFATSSNLSSLFNINLSFNNLTSLEPWVYDRALIGSYSRKVYVNLTSNKISTFTNKMRHYKMCQNEIPFGTVYLFNNSMKYLMDIVNGWKMDIIQALNCYMMKNGQINMLIYINSLTCDCVDYDYYKKAASLFNIFRYKDLPLFSFCKLVDPRTKKSQIVDAFSVDRSRLVCKLTQRCPSICICVYRPANCTLHIYCSSTSLKDLPTELPELPDNRTKYKLDFSNNRLLRRLEYRDYFVNTSILDVSNCGVDEVSDWEDIAKIQTINFSGNNITSLPHLSMYNTTGKLNLANNPWKCSCNNRWMSEWLNYMHMKDRLSQQVFCDSPSRLHGKNIIKIGKKEFCVDPASEVASKAASEAVWKALTISLSSISGVIVVLLSVGVIVYRLRVKLYTRWKFHPFDRDECLGEDMDYDVFLSCSSLDDDQHGMRILKLIESKGYRVCYHERDFLPGQLISDNIGTSIERSKRTVCLLSEHFLRSAYCMHEFKAAYHHNIIEKGKKRLIVLMMLDNPKDLLHNDDRDTATLRQFLRQYTYIDYTAEDWLDKLLYALPLHGLLQNNDTGNDNVELVAQ